MYDDYENKKALDFTDWKVFIDNTSEWYDEINKQASKCYIEPKYMRYVLSQLLVFTASRSSNLPKYNEIKEELDSTKEIIFTANFSEILGGKDYGELKLKALDKIINIIHLLSLDLSEAILIPKPNKKEEPFKKQNTPNDEINKALYKNNKTLIGKDGVVTHARKE